MKFNSQSNETCIHICIYFSLCWILIWKYRLYKICINLLKNPTGRTHGKSTDLRPVPLLNAWGKGGEGVFFFFGWGGGGEVCVGEEGARWSKMSKYYYFLGFRCRRLLSFDDKRNTMSNLSECLPQVVIKRSWRLLILWASLKIFSIVIYN